MLADRIRMGNAGRKKVDQYTKSLLHFNGIDGSTNFKDETGKIWTPSGGAQIDTAQSKFGGASGYFPSGNITLAAEDRSDLLLPDGDYTIDFWVRFEAYHSYYENRIFYFSNNYRIYLHDTDGVRNLLYRFYTTPNTSTGITVSPNYVQLDEWHHYAIVRNGNTLNSYMDGVLQETKDLTGITTYNDPTATVCTISQAAYPVQGWIDEFRISFGIARWTSNFTPPTKEY